MADRNFLEFSYLRMLKSRIEEYSIVFFRCNADSATLFHCTESQLTEFIKDRITRRGLFDNTKQLTTYAIIQTRAVFYAYFRNVFFWKRKNKKNKINRFEFLICYYSHLKNKEKKI